MSPNKPKFKETGYLDDISNEFLELISQDEELVEKEETKEEKKKEDQ